MAGRWIPGILLFPSPPSWDYKSATTPELLLLLFLTWVLCGLNSGSYACKAQELFLSGPHSFIIIFFINCFIIPEYSLGTHHTCILWMLFRHKLWVPPLYNHCQIVVPARARLWFSCGQVWMHTSHVCSNNSWKSTSQNGSALSSSELSLTMSQSHKCIHVFQRSFFFFFLFNSQGR